MIKTENIDIETEPNVTVIKTEPTVIKTEPGIDIYIKTEENEFIKVIANTSGSSIPKISLKDLVESQKKCEVSSTTIDSPKRRRKPGPLFTKSSSYHNYQPVVVINRDEQMICSIPTRSKSQAKNQSYCKNKVASNLLKSTPSSLKERKKTSVTSRRTSRSTSKILVLEEEDEEDDFEIDMNIEKELEEDQCNHDSDDDPEWSPTSKKIKKAAVVDPDDSDVGSNTNTKKRNTKFKLKKQSHESSADSTDSSDSSQNSYFAISRLTSTCDIIQQVTKNRKPLSPKMPLLTKEIVFDKSKMKFMLEKKLTQTPTRSSLKTISKISTASPVVAAANKTLPAATVTTSLPKSSPVADAVRSPDLAASATANPASSTITASLVKPWSKGDFLIENKTYPDDTWPIWRVDSGRLLQKYESIEYQDKQCHRGLSTYSSWSDNDVQKFKVVKVNFLTHRRGMEIVEVMQQYRAKLVDSNALALKEDHPMLDDFNVFIQILLSQVLEDSFIDAIKKEDDDYYIKSYNSIKKVISDTLAELPTNHWKYRFKAAIGKRPYIHTTNRSAQGKTCQICNKTEAEKAEQSVELSGLPYSKDTMTHLTIVGPQRDEFMFCEKSLSLIQTYHKLAHFEFTTFRQCHSKVSQVKAKTSEHKEILDTILNNRAWVLKIFEELEEIVEACKQFADKTK